MRFLAALLLCVVGLSGSTLQVRGTSEPLPHDAYVWQRVWTSGVVAAVGESADIVRAWRILVAEADKSGRWTGVGVPWDAVRGTGRPVIAVFRIDGRLDEERMPALLDRIAATAGTLAVAGIEIDYDCPTSKLTTYRKFLAALRGRLAPALALSITALPTWMESPALDGLSTSVSEMVLQVHAVDDPRQGLFDPDRAERWVRAFGRRIHRPFRVALPAYDVRVTWRADGRLGSVEGERPLLQGRAPGQLLTASPEAVLYFLHNLQSSAPEGLAGIVWFRLPTDADSRAWGRETWRAVVTDRLPTSVLSAALVATSTPDLWTVTLSNEGAVDAPLPSQVRLDPSCAVADGANGFRLKSLDGGLLALETNGAGRLRPHRERIIGWARCQQPGRQLHVAK